MNRNSSRIFAVVAAATLASVFSGCKTAASAKYADEPDVTFQQLQGGNLPLASLKGKVVLVNFWATWCEPCQIEIPWLISFQQKYSSRGFTLLGVAMDEEGQKVVAPFVQKTQYDVGSTKMTMNYPIVIGNPDVAQKFGGLFGYPSSFLISRDGKIVKRIVGLVSENDLAREIEQQLSASAPASSSATSAAVH